jgi:hypothetical protein
MLGILTSLYRPPGGLTKCKDITKQFEKLTAQATLRFPLGHNISLIMGSSSKWADLYRKRLNAHFAL